MILRKTMVALAITVIGAVVATTEASARGWGHHGGFYRGYYGRGFYGPGFGYYGYPFGYGGPGGWGYGYIPYEEQWSESGPSCYRELRGRTRTNKGWRDRYVTVCPGAR